MIYLLAIIGGAIYRLRGGPLKDYFPEVFGTQLSRLAWAVPTAAVAWGAGALPYYMGVSLVLSVFLGLALIGHGAHMVTGAKQWRVTRTVLVHPNETELVTFWLPAVFGGTPTMDWSDRRIEAYEVIGMATCGLVRHAITFAPLFWGHSTAAVICIVAGLIHGPLYWAAHRVGGDSRLGEWFIGASTWLVVIATLL